jgi:hypothetical protein
MGLHLTAPILLPDAARNERPAVLGGLVWFGLSTAVVASVVLWFVLISAGWSDALCLSVRPL